MLGFRLRLLVKIFYFCIRYFVDFLYFCGRVFYVFYLVMFWGLWVCFVFRVFRRGDGGLVCCFEFGKVSVVEVSRFRVW